MNTSFVHKLCSISKIDVETRETIFQMLSIIESLELVNIIILLTLLEDRINAKRFVILLKYFYLMVT